MLYSPETNYGSADNYLPTLDMYQGHVDTTRTHLIEEAVRMQIGLTLDPEVRIVEEALKDHCTALASRAETLLSQRLASQPSAAHIHWSQEFKPLGNQIEEDVRVLYQSILDTRDEESLPRSFADHVRVTPIAKFTGKGTVAASALIFGLVGEQAYDGWKSIVSGVAVGAAAGKGIHPAARFISKKVLGAKMEEFLEPVTPKNRRTLKNMQREHKKLLGSGLSLDEQVQVIRGLEIQDDLDRLREKLRCGVEEWIDKRDYRKPATAHEAASVLWSVTYEHTAGVLGVNVLTEV